MKKILLVVGTRPEAIKMAPVYIALKNEPAFDIRLCLTGQHRELVQDVLNFFNIQAENDLAVMEQSRGDLTRLTSLILTKLKEVIEDFRPVCVLVQGDTTSAFAGALAAFYAKIKVGHLEAGLRTFDKENPYPEEFYRTSISRLADFHFAPTTVAKENLMSEKIPQENILLTGNTVIDALLFARKRIAVAQPIQNLDKRFVLLVTIHRRENHGAVFRGICKALRELAKRENWLFQFTLHPNSAIYSIAMELLNGIPNIQLLDPQPYGAFVQRLLQSDLILTDSGGIQEEAAMLGKAVLLVRKKTERNEAVEAGIVSLVGNEQKGILRKVGARMDNFVAEANRHESSKIFGDGKASERIVAFLKGRL